MPKIKVADRIAASHKRRIDALAYAIQKDGIDAAIAYAQSVFEGKGGANEIVRNHLAIAYVELCPDDPAIWDDHELNTNLRAICAEAIASGDALSEALRAFASMALMKSIPAKGRGKPSDPWQRSLACIVLQDLKLAGVPVYQSESSNGKASFTGVQIVRKYLVVEERTLRGWWQSRPKVVRDI